MRYLQYRRTLFTDCPCCGNRIGGSTTDCWKMCRRCTKARCNVVWRIDRHTHKVG